MALSGTKSRNSTKHTKQQIAIAALLSGKDVPGAAKQAGVGERTVWRWLDEDADFKETLRTAESRAIGDAVRRLVGATNSALNVVMVIMLDTKNPASVRLRAAISILDQMVKLVEFHSMEERLSRLEELYGDLAK